MNPGSPSSDASLSAEEAARKRFLVSLGLQAPPSAPEGEASRQAPEAEEDADLALSSHGDDWELPGYPAGAGATFAGPSRRIPDCRIERVEFTPAGGRGEASGTGLDSEAEPGFETASAMPGESAALDAGAVEASPPEDSALHSPASGAAADACADGEEPFHQLECPKCRGELILKREHVGVEGSCVWCGTRIVATASGPERRVRAFPLFQPGREAEPESGRPELLAEEFPAELPGGFGSATGEALPPGSPAALEPDATVPETTGEAAFDDVFASSWGLPPAATAAPPAAPTLPPEEPSTRFETPAAEDFAPPAGENPAGQTGAPGGPGDFEGGFAAAWELPPAAASPCSAPTLPPEEPFPDLEIPGVAAFVPPADEDQAPQARPGDFGGGFASAWASAPGAGKDAPDAAFGASPADEDEAPAPCASSWGPAPGFGDAAPAPAPASGNVPGKSLAPEAGGFSAPLGFDGPATPGSNPDPGFGDFLAGEPPLEPIPAAKPVDDDGPLPLESGFHIEPPSEDPLFYKADAGGGSPAFVARAEPPAASEPPAGSFEPSLRGPAESGPAAASFSDLFAPDRPRPADTALFGGGDGGYPQSEATEADPCTRDPAAPDPAIDASTAPPPAFPAGAAPPLVESQPLGSSPKKRSGPSKGFLVLMMAILGLVCGAALASFVLPVGELVSAARARMEGFFPGEGGAVVLHETVEQAEMR